MVPMLVTGAWIALAIGVSQLIGWTIRLANRRAAEALAERNFVVDVDPLQTPLPPDPRSVAEEQYPISPLPTAPRPRDQH